MAGATFFRAVIAVVVLLLGSTGVFAQNPPSPGGGNSPATAGGTGTRGRSPDAPQDQFPDVSRPVYLSGSVRLPDGSPPPSTVVIERVCGGVVRPEGYTDSSGRFSFIVANPTSGVFMDASVPGDAATRGNTSSRTANGAASNLVGCEIRGNLAGFISESIVLGFRRSMDNPNIGTIIMRPLENVQGYTFSITTAAASKDAQKAYERGLDNVKKQKWADAERELVKAVETYPKYAIAWFELGRVYHQQKKIDEAKRAYRQALQMDSKFISPYGPLIALNASERKWQDVVSDSSQMLKLNPYVSADIYFYGAVANYNLNHIDVAEEDARQAAKLDSQHKIPKINHLLGVILAEKRDYDAARENIQIYLKYSPNAPDAAAVTQLLADIDARAASK